MNTAKKEEILSSLELSRREIKSWLSGVEEFCVKHGGAPRYSGLLDLVRRYKEDGP